MHLDSYKNEIINFTKKYFSIENIELHGSFSTPPNSKLGDLAFSCFELSKNLKRAPNEIAGDLATNMVSCSFSKIEAVGPYLNFFLERSDFAKKVLEIGYDNERNTKKGRVMVEYMNANPNKPLHIGQARNISIGDSVIRCLRYLGYHVDAVNYGDDSGVNVGYNMVGHVYYGLPLESDKKFDHYCGDIYTQMRLKDEDEDFKKLLSETLLKIEKGNDPEISKLQSDYTRKCVKAQIESCENMNSYFDLINWETDILHLNFFAEALDILKEKGYVKYESEGKNAGCYVIDLSSLKEFSAEDKKTQILIKSDGVATYVGKDIAYAMWKLGYLKRNFYFEPLFTQSNGQVLITTSSKENNDSYDFGNYDRAIAVIDNRQSFAQNVVIGSLNLLGYLNSQKEYTHLSYGVVHITPKTLLDFSFELTQEEKAKSRLPFSSRKGWFVTIDETLEKLKAKAYSESKKRNPDMSDDDLSVLSNKIAISALRYFLISSGESLDLVFDIDDVLAMEGETGPYLMYSYARICNLKKKLESCETGINSINPQISLISNDMEFEILKKMDELPLVISKLEKNLSPNLMARYTYELAKLISSYYGNVRIVTADKELNSARYLFLEKLRIHLKTAMNLIGMIESERM